MAIHYFQIAPDIRYAIPLPGWFYPAAEAFDQCREGFFARSWQCIVNAEEGVRRPYDALPFRFMDDFLEEPFSSPPSGYAPRERQTMTMAAG